MSIHVSAHAANGSRATEGRGRFAATTVGFAALVVLVGTLVVASRWSQLPAMVASHWGRSGVDATQSKAAFTVTLGVLILGLTLVLGLLGWFISSDARRMLAASAGFATGLVGVLGYGALVAQVGITDPKRATIPALTAVAAVGVSVLAAVLLWHLNPPPPGVRRAAAEPLSRGAATIAAASSERVVWLGRASPATGLTAVVVSVLTLAVVSSALASPWAAVPTLVVGALVVLVLHARVVIDEDGVRVTSAGIRWLKVPLAEIRDASHRDIAPLRDFGGYGMRSRRDRRGYVIRAGDALELHQADGTSTYVTLQHADQAAAVVNTLVARLPH